MWKRDGYHHFHIAWDRLCEPELSPVDLKNPYMNASNDPVVLRRGNRITLALSRWPAA